MSELSDDTLKAWAEMAKMDNWHILFVGSDVRQLIGNLQRLRAKVSAAAISDTTTGDVLSEMKRQLEWRGSGDQVKQGHVVLTRAHADFIHTRVVELILVQDKLVAEIERLTKEAKSEQHDRREGGGGDQQPA